jgi:HEPN domain-containing protein
MATAADMAAMLLDAAVDDEFVARSLLPIEGVTDGPLGFHCQQAIEKSLKAVLAYKRVEYPYSHDLDGLLRLCEKNDIDVPQELADVDDLSPFAARLRYGATSPTKLDRDRALSRAAAAVAWARTVIDETEASQDQAADLESDRPQQSSS